ncbi:MAG: amino acid adenylation domain-containing protein, partial [Ruminococcus sp.]|nr:amino acid adenylation domain-containing protein [Ruminococcus sp.]
SFYSLSSYDMDILQDYNNTKEDIPITNLNALLHDSFNKYPNKIAIKDNIKSLTYKELDTLSNEVANRLTEKGIHLGDYVGICTERNIYTIVNMLGVLKCGASYVTINSDYPDERINYILKKSDCKLFIKQDIIENVSIEDCRPLLNPVKVPCSNIAYVIFTSGSTGEPKGVAITHQGVCNTIIDINQKWKINSNDKIICVTSFCFDLSVYDIFGALSSGAELIIIPEVRNLQSVLETIRDEEVTIFNSVPAIMNLLVTENSFNKDFKAINSLRLCLMSGDWIPTTLPNAIKKYFPNCQSVSLGGATEGSIWSIYHEIQPEDASLISIPYGRPLANQNMYILSKSLNLCPIDTVGEIYIGGRGVADCYINDAEKSKDSFIHTEQFGKLYKTGDFGKISSNGIMEFLGRRDFQVKINGYRIELSEIENVLNKYKDILNVVVTVENDVLCVFYVSPVEYTTNELIEYASKYLTNYMIPKHFIRVDSIPLTSNGKVNRKALKLPKDINNGSIVYDTSNLSPTERKLVEIWKKFLNTDRININSVFFNLGGDSVNMIQIISEVNNTFNVDIQFQKFLENSSIKEVAMLIDKNNISSDATEDIEKVSFEISPKDKWKPFKLSGLQESYFIGRNSEDYNGLATNGYVELDCLNYDNEKFRRVLQRLIDRHDMLRCAIYPDGTQKFLKTATVPDFPIIDMSNYTKDELDNYILRVRREMTSIRLDLEKPPLIAIQVTKTGIKSAIIHVYVDGLIIDGWSYQLFHLELESLYRDETIEYPPLEATYRDYIKFKEYQQTTNKYQRDKQYWLSKIDTLPNAGTLPLLKPLKDLEYIEGNQVKCGLNIKDWHLLEEKSKVFGVSPFTVIFTSFALTIARWNKEQRFMLNIPEFDRPQFHKDVNKIIGVCSAFLLFVVDNNPKDTFLDLVVKNHEQLWELKEHNSFSGMEVLREIYKEIKNYDTALVPIVFGMMANVKLPEEQSISVRYQENHTTQIWIDITTTLYNDCIEFNWNSIKGLIDYDMLSRMVEIQKDILHHAIYNDDFWETPCNITLPNYDRNIIDGINNTKNDFNFERFSNIFY